MGKITDTDREKARADWMKANPGKNPDEKAINDQVYQNFYDKAFNDTRLGTGGDVAAALANGAAPYLAEVIGHKMGIDNNPEAKAVAHAIVGAALAAAQGQQARRLAR